MSIAFDLLVFDNLHRPIGVLRRRHLPQLDAALWKSGQSRLGKKVVDLAKDPSHNIFSKIRYVNNCSDGL